MTLEDLKQLKYLDVLVKVRHKICGTQDLVYVQVFKNKLVLCSDTTNDILKDEENYEIIEEILDENLLEVMCEYCNKNEAIIIKDNDIVCSECIKALSIPQISKNVYKFMNNQELKTLLFFKQIDNERYASYNKGIVFFYLSDDCDEWDARVISADDIGTF